MLRLIVLSLATAGPRWLPDTLDAMVPVDANLTVSGATASRATFAEAFLALHARSVVFHFAGDAETKGICTGSAVDRVAATTYFSSGSNATVSACFELGDVLKVVDLKFTNAEPWLTVQDD